MSFTVQIKEEISHIDSTKSEKIAELSGYIRNNSSIVKNKIIMTKIIEKQYKYIDKRLIVCYNSNKEILPFFIT